jgi:hypothetical protein
MKTMNQYLEMDGGIIFNIAIFNRFSRIGDGCYSDICGSFIEGVYQWAEHNLSHIDESENHKYYGWTIHTNCGSVRRVYIPKWVMKIQAKDFKHAKALFNKYLLQDVKFNQSEQANPISY